MSNQEMANHLHDILSSKASMGMGRRRRGGYGEGEVEDIMELYWRCGSAGARKKRSGSKTARKRPGAIKSKNPWVNFVREYAYDNNMLYRDVLKSKAACREYRQIHGATRKQVPCVRKKYGSKTAKKRVVKHRKVVKKRCPPGKRLDKTRSYTRKSGKHVKGYQRCID